jgi:hypothetical protein
LITDRGSAELEITAKTLDLMDVVGLGAIHVLSHPIGAIYHTHHGTLVETLWK